ncbi:MAG: glycosyltransferase family 4 protein [Patescibacteria group bacterium]|nr:glycosyltransferase family 4 protein [Patescibacteria group bacterium]
MRRILTWHVHGNYLYYLTRVKSCDFYIPFKKSGGLGYEAIGSGFPWGKNVHQVPAEEIKRLGLDLILFQSSYPENKIYLQDQFEILSKDQLTLPKVYLEHEPPRDLPTDTKHITASSDTFLVHVTHFNNLMWDSGQTATRVIEHGVVAPEIPYIGDLPKGAVVINNLDKRGRRLGRDVFERVKKEVPLDLIGIDSENLGGLGEIPHQELLKALSRYRFLFNPARYTSLGLAICEAMMIGLPVVGLATTEMVTVVQSGISGFLDTNIEALIPQMKLLINDQNLARQMGKESRQIAQKRFDIQRFVKDWEEVLG